MNRVRVDLPGREYEIVVGPGALGQAGALMAPLLRRRRVAVVTDANVADLHLPALRAALEAEGIAVEALVLPPGEATKGWTNWRGRWSGCWPPRSSGAIWSWPWGAG